MLIVGAVLILTSAAVFGDNSLSGYINEVTAILTLLWVLLLAQGKVSGHIIGIIATLLYGYCTIVERLYGETIIGLLVTLPTCIAGYKVWTKNRRDKTDEEEVVIVNYIPWKEVILAVLSQIIMGIGYYYFLDYLHTEELIFSTITLCTAILDAYFILRRTALAMQLEIIDNLFTTILWLMVVIGGNLGGITFVVQYLILFVYCFYGNNVWSKNRIEQKTIPHKGGR
jgi:nicotinamide mononucleotide transporter